MAAEWSFELDGGGEMITQRTEESDLERWERQQRELEEMWQAIANYTGPVTKCPPGKIERPNGVRRPGRTQKARNGDGR